MNRFDVDPTLLEEDVEPGRQPGKPTLDRDTQGVIGFIRAMDPEIVLEPRGAAGSKAW